MGKKSYLCTTEKGKQDGTQRAASPPALYNIKQAHPLKCGRCKTT